MLNNKYFNPALRSVLGTISDFGRYSVSYIYHLVLTDPASTPTMTVIKPTAASGLAETILAILPFPEHKPFFDCLRERYPRSKIIYYQPPKTDDVRGVEKYWKNDIPVPEGLPLPPPSTPTLTPI